MLLHHLPRLLRQHSDTLWLLGLQCAGLVLALWSLPLMARGLGPQAFGQVMLAQALVFFAVLFIDAGFNTESQRLAALAHNELQLCQTLLDNLLARLVCSVPVALVVLVLGYHWPGMAWPLVLASLPQLLGTLLFPQWWYIAQRQGKRMGLLGIVGRLASIVLLLLSVHSSADSVAAALAISLATPLSGLACMGLGWRRFQRVRKGLVWGAWPAYLHAVRPTLFSGFFASASASLPLLVLGHSAGAGVAGLYASADRLTRAAAHLLGLLLQVLTARMSQSTATQAGQGAAMQASRTSHNTTPPPNGSNNNNATDTPHHLQSSKTLLQGLLLGLLLTFAAAYGLAAPVLRALYGDAFVAATQVLQCLAFWLVCNTLRRAMLGFWWSATGALQTVSRFQWAEAALVLLCAVVGAQLGQALGLAWGMVAVELVLMAAMGWRMRGKPK
jgi:O-antigen/teichoic acid export membrane protein